MSILKFTVIDETTNKPIEALTAQIVKNGKATNQGTISNAKGEVNLPYSQPTDEVLISHVAYGAFVMPVKDFVNKTMLKLKPKVNTLPTFTVKPNNFAKVLFGIGLAFLGVKVGQHYRILPKPLFNLKNKN